MHTTTGGATPPTPTGAKPSTPRRDWAPRIWEGCDFFAWLRLLARNRFAVQLPYVYIAVIVTVVSFYHSLVKLLQEIWFGKRVRNTRITHPPIFIVGHWRTGTTLLHEFLILDARHNYPTTYECMEPNHFLLTEGLFTRWLHFLTPSHRPMDNMAAGFDRPQEDEFALCMLGEPSPYFDIAFPDHLPREARYLDFGEMTARERTSWKRTFLRFLKQVTYRNPKRLVLKSPPHSCRIRELLELFPDALFIHIVRDPYVVFPSTVNLWKSLQRAHGLQRPTGKGVEEYVFNTFLRLYQKLEEGKKLVDHSRFYELRYEDLVRDPVGEMRELYDHLGLGEFERVRPRLEQYLESIKGYETNRYTLTAEQAAEVTRRWGEVIRDYGYGVEEEERLRFAGQARETQAV